MVTRIRRWWLEKLSWSFPELALQLLFSTCLHFCLLHFHHLVPILTFELHMDKLGHKETWKVLLLSHATMRYSTDQAAFSTFPRASLSSSGMLTVLLWLFGTELLSCSVEKFIFGWCWLFCNLVKSNRSCYSLSDVPPPPAPWPHTYPIHLPSTHTSHNGIFRNYWNAWSSVQKVVCLWFTPFSITFVQISWWKLYKSF